MVNAESFPFVVAVSLYDTAEEQFVFDQPEVIVGRSPEADLHVAHPAISRRQLTIQRIIPPIGRPRFRIVPHAAKNPLYVNGVPAVEGSLGFGDVVAVGETRLVLRKARRRAATKLSPMRIAIGATALLTLGLVAWTALAPPPAASVVSLPPVKLFANLPRVGCNDPVTCTERARTAYQHGKSFAKQAGAVAGAWYHAAIELYRAAEFERLSGRRIDGLESVREDLRAAATAAEQLYNDLQFRLARDLRANDAASLRETIAQIVAVVPDEQHPMRVQLDQYLRDHPLPHKE
ncbi:MAG: Inner rane component of cytoplasmic domain [bacterium]|nr:Inner rane component of cytoplasmic domain [bacterium]